MRVRRSVQKVLAWILVVTILMSMGMNAWADEPESASETMEEQRLATEERSEPHSEVVQETEIETDTEKDTETQVKDSRKSRVAGDDRSSDFKLDTLYIRIVNDTKTVYESNKTNPAQVTMDAIPKFEFSLSFSQSNAEQKDFVKDEYIVFDIVNIKGSAKGLFANFSLPMDLFDNGVKLGTGQVMQRTEGDGSITLYYKVIFGENIANKNHIEGTAKGSALIRNAVVGEMITVESRGQEIIEIKVVDFVPVGGGHPGILTPEYGFETQKKAGETDQSEDVVTWNMIMSEFFFKQFEDFDAGITSDYGDIIIEDEPDEYQTFFGAGSEANQGGMSLVFSAQVFTYDPADIGVDGQLKPTKRLYYLRTSAWFSIATKDPAKNKGMTFYEPGNTAASQSAAEIYVKEHPKTWTVFKSAVNGKEKLVINLGAPGSTGYKYSEVFSAEEFTNLKAKMQRGVDAATEVLAAADVANKTDPNDELTDAEGQTAKRSEWETSRRAYQAAVDFYGTDPYISYLGVNVNTKVLRDKAIADGVSSVINSYKISGSFGSKSGDAIKENYWSGTLTGKAVNGDAQIFKADSLYENSEHKIDDKEINGFIGQVGFEVYKADGTGPLKFEEVSGKYEYRTKGSLTTIMTSHTNGSAIVSKLDPGAYYFKEVSAPSGYYTGQNQKIDFTIDNSYVTYRLANNAARGVELVKVKKDEPAKKLSKAVFELYTYTTDIETAAKVEGFSLTTINGKSYYVYDGGTDALETLSDGTLKVVQLPAGKYYLKEVQAPSGYQVSDKKYTFLLTDQLSTGQEPIVNLGNIENTPDIEVDTVALDIDGANRAAGTIQEGLQASVDEIIEDTITYKNLKPNTRYLAVGTLQHYDDPDKKVQAVDYHEFQDDGTGQDSGNGSRVQTVKEFVTDHTGNGSTKVTFQFNGKNLGKTNLGSYLVAYEELYEYDETAPDGKGALAAVHKDIEDKDQTVHYEHGKSIEPLAPSENLLVANVAITKSVDKTETTVNDIVTYTLEVSHTGDAVTLTDINVIDYIPQSTKFYSAENGGEYVWEEDDTQYVSWEIASLAPGECIALKFKVKIDECVSGTTIRNTAILKCDTEIEVESINSNEVTTKVADKGERPGRISRNGNATKYTSTVKTGDDSPLLATWVLLLAGALGVMLLRKKRRT